MYPRLDAVDEPECDEAGLLVFLLLLGGVSSTSDQSSDDGSFLCTPAGPLCLTIVLVFRLLLPSGGPETTKAGVTLCEAPFGYITIQHIH